MEVKKLECLIANPNKKVYLRTEKNGKLVTCTKQNAQHFEYAKAHNIVKNSIPKTLSKFHFKVFPLYEKINNTKKEEKEEKPEKVVINDHYIVPKAVTQWIDKVNNTSCYKLASEAEDRYQALHIALIDANKEVMNCLHRIELNPWKNACAGYCDYKALKTVLEKRRKIKDELVIVSEILKSNIKHIASNHLDSVVQDLENRVYIIRDVDEFNNIEL